MKYQYRFDPVAAYEYEDAYSWYWERSKKAAENFIYTVEQSINLICSDPYRYKNTYKTLLEISLKKYPYILFTWLMNKRKQ